MTDFERRVEVATAALCSRSSSPETRRKMRRYARRVVRALDAAASVEREGAEAAFHEDMRAIVRYGARA